MLPITVIASPTILAEELRLFSPPTFWPLGSIKPLTSSLGMFYIWHCLYVTKLSQRKKEERENVTA